MAKDALATGAGDIKGEAAFVSVHGKVVGTLVTDIRRPPLAGLVTETWSLNLDDISAQIPKHHSAIGSGKRLSLVDDAYPCEWPIGHARFLRFCLAISKKNRATAMLAAHMPNTCAQRPDSASEPMTVPEAPPATLQTAVSKPPAEDTRPVGASSNGKRAQCDASEAACRQNGAKGGDQRHPTAQERATQRTCDEH